MRRGGLYLGKVGGTPTHELQFAPELALLAPDAVHDARDVLEVRLRATAHGSVYQLRCCRTAVGALVRSRGGGSMQPSLKRRTHLQLLSQVCSVRALPKAALVEGNGARLLQRLAAHLRTCAQKA